MIVTRKQVREWIRYKTPANIRRFLIKLGKFYERADLYFPSQVSTLKVFRELGFRPMHCIDIGAHNGDWAKLFASVFPQAHILMIEALEEKQTILRDLAADPANRFYSKLALLGATDNLEVDFFEMGTGSSIFEEISDYERTKNKKTLTTLDALLKQFPEFSNADFMKIDSQGSELEILKGAQGILNTLDMVLLETSFTRTNMGAPLFADIVAYMCKCGYRMVDFCSQSRRKNGILLQSDILFLNETSDLKIQEGIFD